MPHRSSTPTPPVRFYASLWGFIGAAVLALLAFAVVVYPARETTAGAPASAAVEAHV